MTYRLTVDFDAPTVEVAEQYYMAVARGVRSLPAAQVTMRNKGRWRTFLVNCLKWGGVAGLLLAAYWLYCIGEGFGPLRWLKESFR